MTDCTPPKPHSFFQMLGWVKIGMSRIGGWLSIINFLLILASFKQLYNLNISMYVLMPIAFIGSCLLMWFDYKYIFPLEWEYTNRQNDMKVQMDKVEEQLKRIEYKLSDLQDRT